MKSTTFQKTYLIFLGVSTKEIQIQLKLNMGGECLCYGMVFVIVRSYDREMVDRIEKWNIIENKHGGVKLVKNHTNLKDITNFLEKAKKLIVSGKYDFVPRRKNMQALAQHGLTITDAKLHKN